MICQIDCLIKSAEEAKASNGNVFLKLKILYVKDSSLVEQKAISFCKLTSMKLSEFAGTAWSILLKEEIYNEAPSFKIEKFVKKLDEIPSFLIKKSLYDPDRLTESLLKSSSIHCSNSAKNLLSNLLFDCPSVLNKFKLWPASVSLHHSFQSGLIEHTYLMVQSYLGLIGDKTNLYFKYDHSVVISSLILHDLGKIVEYKFNPLKETEVTMQGNLIGHICIVDGMWNAYMCQFGSNLTPEAIDELNHIRHCILSHHGRLEWGSPVSSKTPEACLVHHLDNLQAKSQMFIEAPYDEYHKGLECRPVNLKGD